MKCVLSLMLAYSSRSMQKGFKRTAVYMLVFICVIHRVFTSTSPDKSYMLLCRFSPGGYRMLHLKQQTFTILFKELDRGFF